MKNCPLTILWVEDSSDDVDLLQRAVRRSNLAIQFEVMADGEEAIDRLNEAGNGNQRQLPHLILLDLNLPKKTGRELLGELKKDEKLRIIPVVILTTSNAEVDLTTCYRLGAAAYLVKPTDFTELGGIAKKLYDFWQAVEFPPKM
jgi:CheY-like chemotaxis protein